MNEVVSVVHLETGLVLDLPGNTPTFDVPTDFDESATGPHLRPVGRTLSRRVDDERFLLRIEASEEATGARRWILSIREPRMHRGQL